MNPQSVNVNTTTTPHPREDNNENPTSKMVDEILHIRPNDAKRCKIADEYSNVIRVSEEAQAVRVNTNGKITECEAKTEQSWINTSNACKEFKDRLESTIMHTINTMEYIQDTIDTLEKEVDISSADNILKRDVHKILTDTKFAKLSLDELISSIRSKIEKACPQKDDDAKIASMYAENTMAYISSISKGAANILKYKSDISKCMCTILENAEFAELHLKNVDESIKAW